MRKGFIWNPSNCECECYKSCDFSDYLDYKNCKCKKRLADKLVEECTENIEETRLVEINSTECKHNFFIHMLWLHLYSYKGFSNRPARVRKHKNTQTILNIAFTLLI